MAGVRKLARMGIGGFAILVGIFQFGFDISVFAYKVKIEHPAGVVWLGAWWASVFCVIGGMFAVIDYSREVAIVGLAVQTISLLLESTGTSVDGTYLALFDDLGACAYLPDSNSTAVLYGHSEYFSSAIQCATNAQNQPQTCYCTSTLNGTSLFCDAFQGVGDEGIDGDCESILVTFLANLHGAVALDGIGLVISAILVILSINEIWLQRLAWFGSYTSALQTPIIATSIRTPITSTIAAVELRMDISQSKKLRTLTEPAMATTTMSDEAVAALRKANPFCADCGAADPDWASLNLCVVVCIECSGVHRSLGAHISKIRSLNLDKWTTGSINLLTTLGNVQSNKVWESFTVSFDPIVADGDGYVTYEPKPHANSPRDVKQAFIAAKYEKRRFIASRKPPSSVDRAVVASPSSTAAATSSLLRAARTGNVVAMLSALAGGADVNASTGSGADGAPGDGRERGPSALHVAAGAGHELCVELLCLWGARVDPDDGLQDVAGSAVDVARAKGYAHIVQVLEHYATRQ